MKTLLKPSLPKIILTFFLFIVFSGLWQMTFGLVIMDASFYGVPLHYFTAWGPCQAGQNCSEFNWLYLVLDILFWYVVSAFIMGRFTRAKK